MKIIESNVKNITPSSYDINEVYKFIEQTSRTCYKSEEGLSDNSLAFVGKLIQRQHLAMLEHGTIYLYATDIVGKELYDKYFNNPYSKVYNIQSVCSLGDTPEIDTYITTNYRVIVENGWEQDLKYICEPDLLHDKRFTFKIVCSRAIAQEITRHRVFSFAMESQRYCNYSKDKFDNSITFIGPEWIHESELNKEIFEQSCANAEKEYFTLLNNGLTPQLAREVLPNCTKTELVVTGFKDDWEHFLKLRYFGLTGVPHPEMYKLAKEIYKSLNIIF